MCAVISPVVSMVVRAALGAEACGLSLAICRLDGGERPFNQNIFHLPQMLNPRLMACESTGDRTCLQRGGTVKRDWASRLAAMRRYIYLDIGSDTNQIQIPSPSWTQRATVVNEIIFTLEGRCCRASAPPIARLKRRLLPHMPRSPNSLPFQTPC